jgi:hypothetical protein
MVRVREDERAAAVTRTSDPTARDTDRALRALIITYEYPQLGGGGGVIFRDVAE